MRFCARALIAIAALPPCLAAQGALVIPPGLTSAEGNSLTSYPWGRGAAPVRVQYVYDAANFTSQAVTAPMVIRRLRWRANGAAVGQGGTYGNASVLMSTCPVDHASVATAFASNHGLDLATVFTGPVSVQAGSGAMPNDWYVEVLLTNPFVYDPTLGGDLNIDLATDGTGWGSNAAPAMDCQTTGAQVSRVYELTSATATTGTVQQATGAVLEVSFHPVLGLYPDLSATPRSGARPLQVQFTDRSYTSDPGGVTAWQWDFDNDGLTDSTLRNPVHTYTACGTYAVRLTVQDAQHGAATVVQNAAVVVDPIRAAFTATPRSGPAPLQVQFTCASTGPVTAWAWDFDNDGNVDSTLQNPTWTYATPGNWSVRLQASSACNSSAVVQRDYVSVVQATSNVRSPELIEFQFNEVRGQTAANTAATAVMPATAALGNAAWQGDPGRVRYRGNEPGAGMLAHTSGAPNLNLVNSQAPLSISGSMTIAWWQRLGATPPPGAAYVFGGTGAAAVRCFTGGAAGSSLSYRGATTGDVAATTSVQQNPGVWQHVALVIDDTARQAVWYFDGLPEAPVALSAAHMVNIAEFHVGWHTAGNASYTAHYDLDDFRVYARALGAAAIGQVMAGENPTAGRFGNGCAGPAGEPSIDASGVPTLGNAAFAVRLLGAENARLCCIVLGLTPRATGPYDLGPVLGTGCTLHVDAFRSIFHLTTSGSALQAMPVPNNVTMVGFHVYAQWLVLGTSGAVTPALDINIR